MVHTSFGTVMTGGVGGDGSIGILVELLVVLPVSRKNSSTSSSTVLISLKSYRKFKNISASATRVNANLFSTYLVIYSRYVRYKLTYVM